MLRNGTSEKTTNPSVNVVAASVWCWLQVWFGPKRWCAGAACQDGVFASYSVQLANADVAAPTFHPVAKAGPPRDVPTQHANGKGKAREPTMQEWGAAARYTVTLGATPTVGDFRLVVDYVGDAARVYFNKRLLTDNWYSAYDPMDEGALEVGLNYLAGENPGLLLAGAALDVWVLPLKRSSLEHLVYLQNGSNPVGSGALWPDFQGQDAVCALNSVSIRGMQYAELRLAGVP